MQYALYCRYSHVGFFVGFMLLSILLQQVSIYLTLKLFGII